MRHVRPISQTIPRRAQTDTFWNRFNFILDFLIILLNAIAVKG